MDLAGFSFLPDESAGSGGSGQRGGSEAQRGPQRGSYAPVHTSESGPAGTDRETTLERVARQLRHGLFGVLFTMNKNSGSGPQAGSDRLDLALMMIDFLQMVAFPLNPGNMFPWRHNATMRWATLVLAQISLAGLEDVESGIQVGVFALSLAWIASVACVAIWAAISFARNHFSVIWPLYYLRLTAHLTTTILFLPLSAILMSAFRCEDTWAGTSMTCWGPLHGILVLSTALIVLFMAILSLVVAAVFFDRDMTSPSFFARAHGRVHMGMLMVKLVLTFAFTLSHILPAWLLAIVCWLSGIYWAGTAFWLRPYYHDVMNSLEVASGCAHLWACFSLSLALSFGDSDTLSAGLVFWCGAPFAGAAGIGLSPYRWSLLARQRGVKTAYDAELKARMLLQPAIAFIARQSRAADDTASAGRETAATLTLRRRREGVDESATTQTDQVLFSDLLRRADAEFRAAVLHLADSSTIHLFYSQYLRVFKGAEALEQQQLALLTTKNPPLDGQYLAYERSKAAGTEESSATGSSNIIARVTEDKHRAEAIRWTGRAQRLQTQFWAALMESRPSLSHLHALSADLNSATTVAERSFRALMSLNPRSVVTLRLYGRYRLQVENDLQRSEELMEKADVLEEAQQRILDERLADVELLGKGMALDADADQIGVVTISTEAGSLGRILYMNSAGLRQFGFRRSRVVSQNVAWLVPPPIAEMHQGFLRAHKRSQGRLKLQEPRTVFGLHRSGYIFPMVLQLRPLSSHIGGLFHRLKADQRFILCSLRGQVMVESCCLESYLMLGLVPAQCVLSQPERKPKLATYMPSLAVDMADEENAEVLAAERTITVHNVNPSFSGNGTCKVTVRVQRWRPRSAASAGDAPQTVFLLRWRLHQRSQPMQQRWQAVKDTSAGQADPPHSSVHLQRTVGAGSVIGATNIAAYVEHVQGGQGRHSKHSPRSSTVYSESADASWIDAALAPPGPKAGAAADQPEEAQRKDSPPLPPRAVVQGALSSAGDDSPLPGPPTKVSLANGNVSIRFGANGGQSESGGNERLAFDFSQDLPETENSGTSDPSSDAKSSTAALDKLRRGLQGFQGVLAPELEHTKRNLFRTFLLATLFLLFTAAFFSGSCSSAVSAAGDFESAITAQVSFAEEAEAVVSAHLTRTGFVDRVWSEPAAVRTCLRHEQVSSAVGALASKALPDWTDSDTTPLPPLPSAIRVGRTEPSAADPAPSLREGSVGAARRALAPSPPRPVAFLESAVPVDELRRQAAASFVRRDMVEWGREGALLVPTRASLAVAAQHHESALQQACAGAEQKGFGPRDSGDGVLILGTLAGDLGARLNETSAHYLLFANEGTHQAAELLFFATLLLVAIVDVIVPRRLVPAVRQLQRRKDEVIELLSQVPRPVVRRLRLRCEQREKDAATEASATSDGDSTDEDDEDDEDDDERFMAQGVGRGNALPTLDETDEQSEGRLASGSKGSGPPRHMLGSLLELEQVLNHEQLDRRRREAERRQHQQGTSRSVIMISRAKQSDRGLLGSHRTSSSTKRGLFAGPQLERESKDHLWLQVRFAGPVYLVVVGLTAVLLGVDVQLDQAAELSRSAYLCAQRTSLLFHAAAATRYALTALPEATLATCPPSFWTGAGAAWALPAERANVTAEAFLSAAHSAEDAALEGQGGLGGVSVAEAGNPMRRLVLNDACEGTGVDPEACRAEQDGALTQGTHTAVRRLVNAFGDANDAVSAARLAHAGNCSTYLAAVRGSRSVQAMGDLALALTHPFLREALWAVQAGFLDAAEAKVEASRRTVWGGTVALVCVVWIYFLTVYGPLIREADRSMKRARMMLFLLPQTVVSDIKPLRQFVASLTHDLQHTAAAQHTGSRMRREPTQSRDIFGTE